MNTQPRNQESARDAARSTQGQARADRPATHEKFAEPRGWALRWDGFALAGCGRTGQGKDKED